MQRAPQLPHELREVTKFLEPIVVNVDGKAILEEVRYSSRKGLMKRSECLDGGWGAGTVELVEQVHVRDKRPSDHTRVDDVCPRYTWLRLFHEEVSDVKSTRSRETE